MGLILRDFKPVGADVEFSNYNLSSYRENDKKDNYILFKNFFNICDRIGLIYHLNKSKLFFISQLLIMQNHPDPETLYPIEGVTRTFFLKKINHPQICMGDYTYYDDLDDPNSFEKNVLYLFDFMKDKLIIGKFCQLATGIRFIMNGSNHAMNSISTYPFKIFGKSWASTSLDVVSKGDTVIQNDVWIGNSTTIMQGIRVGNGAIIGTQSLVTKNIGPYEIWGGNPAQLIRKRFDQDTINFLLELAWWNWPIDKITLHLNAITSGDIKKLRTLI